MRRSFEEDGYISNPDFMMITIVGRTSRRSSLDGLIICFAGCAAIIIEILWDFMLAPAHGNGFQKERESLNSISGCEMRRGTSVLGMRLLVQSSVGS